MLLALGEPLEKEALTAIGEQQEQSISLVLQ